MSNPGHERDDLAREIESLLSVEPSLGFEARISARVAETAGSSRVAWRLAIWIPIAATAVMLVAAVVLMRQAPPVPASVALPERGNAVSQASVPMRHEESDVQTPRVARGAHPSGAVPSGAAPIRAVGEAAPIVFAESEGSKWPFLPLTAPELTVPDVMIQPDERRVLELVLRRPLELTARDEEDRVSDGQVPHLPPLEPIRLTDIALSPLPALTPLEGD